MSFELATVAGNLCLKLAEFCYSFSKDNRAQSQLDATKFYSPVYASLNHVSVLLRIFSRPSNRRSREKTEELRNEILENCRAINAQIREHYGLVLYQTRVTHSVFENDVNTLSSFDCPTDEEVLGLKGVVSSLADQLFDREREISEEVDDRKNRHIKAFHKRLEKGMREALRSRETPYIRKIEGLRSSDECSEVASCEDGPQKATI